MAKVFIRKKFTFEKEQETKETKKNGRKQHAIRKSVLKYYIPNKLSLQMKNRCDQKTAKAAQEAILNKSSTRVLHFIKKILVLLLAICFFTPQKLICSSILRYGNV